jgi:hypothetical protein
MPARKPPSPNEKPQSERFIEAARKIGASEEATDFEKVFAKVTAPAHQKAGGSPSKTK